MYCKHCGQPLNDGVTFCTNCGSPVGGPENSENQENRSNAGQQTFTENVNTSTNTNASGFVPTKREIAINIVLSIVTCGIYAYIWMYYINEDMGRVSGRTEMSGGMVVLLSIVTCGIYAMIWAFQQGQKVDELKTRNNIPSSNTNVIYLLLAIFGLSIVVLGLEQNELNAIADGRYKA